MKFIDLRAALAAVCALLLVLPPPQRAFAAQDAPQDPPQYKLIILRGDNAQNNIKKGRATRPVVEVRDRNNKPVAGVAVVFMLPSSGPSGTFVGGGQMTTVTTNNLGQASTSFTPNTVPGKYNINVSTSQSAAVQIATVNVITTAVVTTTTLAIIIAAVAAAGAGTAVALTRDGGNGNATGPGGIRIGPGTGGAVTPPN